MIRHVAAYIQQSRTNAERLRGIQVPQTIIDENNVLWLHIKPHDGQTINLG